LRRFLSSRALQRALDELTPGNSHTQATQSFFFVGNSTILTFVDSTTVQKELSFLSTSIRFQLLHPYLIQENTTTQ